MKKFYTELAYLLGIIILALGASMMERADFGLSMVVAPAYLIYLKVSTYYSWFTFGMSEYCFQAFLIVMICIIMKRFKKVYLFSFITAFFYGNVLDLFMKLISLIPEAGIVQRVIFFLLGVIACAVGVSLVFHTYIAPEAYELVVKEITAKYDFNINRVKTAYDCTSCVIAIIMSFAFIGVFKFEGVKLGTIMCALINGSIIGWFSKLFEKHFEFIDGLKLRKYFE